MTDTSQKHDPSNQEASRSLVPIARNSVPTRPPRVVHPAAESDTGLSPRRIIDAIRFWWKWALPAGIVLGTVASLTVYWLFVPKYEASAWIQIEEHVPFLAFESKDQGSSSKAFVATQIELLRSPMVVRPVIAERELIGLPELNKQDNPLEWLRRQIVVSRIGESELYSVSFTCSQPKAAARAVNAIVDSYFKQRKDDLQKRSEEVVNQLRSEVQWRSQEVEELRKSVREIAKQVTGRDPFKDGSDASATEAKPLADLLNQLINTEVEEIVLTKRLHSLESADLKRIAAVPESMIDAEIERNPKTLQFAEALADQNLHLSSILTSAAQGKDSSEYQRTADRVVQNQKAFETWKSELRSQTKARLEAQRLHDHHQAIAQLKAEIEKCQLTKSMLEERRVAELAKVQQSTGDSVTLMFEKDKLERAENVLDQISDRIVVLSTEQSAPRRVFERKTAEVPVAPVQSLPYLNALVALLAGLAAPFGLAVLKEQLTGRISTAENVEKSAHLAVLGEITALPTRSSKAKRLAPREHRAVQMFQESIEALRSSVLLGANAESVRILAIASAVNKEGKTSVAVQLAASIARATQKRVLLIDGDLRDPSVHRLFEIPSEPGLADVLSGRSSLAEAIVATRTELVDVLPAGELDSNPHKLFEELRWSKLIAEIPATYRYVIIDSPPVLAASEALVLARSADAVLVCAMRDVTRQSQLKKATERVLFTGAKVAGVVISGIPTSEYAGRYGSYFYDADL